MENDIVLYRYAGVLLMKSEAKVRNGENGNPYKGGVPDITKGGVSKVKLAIIKTQINANLRKDKIESALICVSKVAY